MHAPSFAVKSGDGRHLKIGRVTPEARVAIIRYVEARRVAQNCETRGCEPGHESKDWRKAGSEILRLLNCEFLVSNYSVEFSMHAARYGEGEIEFCLEPRHLKICGMECNSTPEAVTESEGFMPLSHPIIYTHELLFEINPSEVSARFTGCTIEIESPNPYAKRNAAAAI